jgi:hypothetical protein
MDEYESPLLLADPFEDALEEARLLIRPEPTRERAWPALAAAAFFAISAMTFATTAILSPPAHLTHINPNQGPM